MVVFNKKVIQEKGGSKATATNTKSVSSKSKYLTGEIQTITPRYNKHIPQYPQDKESKNSGMFSFMIALETYNISWKGIKKFLDAEYFSKLGDCLSLDKSRKCVITFEDTTKFIADNSYLILVICVTVLGVILIVGIVLTVICCKQPAEEQDLQDIKEAIAGSSPVNKPKPPADNNAANLNIEGGVEANVELNANVHVEKKVEVQIEVDQGYTFAPNANLQAETNFPNANVMGGVTPNANINLGGNMNAAVELSPPRVIDPPIVNPPTTNLDGGLSFGGNVNTNTNLNVNANLNANAQINANVNLSPPIRPPNFNVNINVEAQAGAGINFGGTE